MTRRIEIAKLRNAVYFVLECFSFLLHSVSGVGTATAGLVTAPVGGTGAVRAIGGREGMTCRWLAASCGEMHWRVPKHKNTALSFSGANRLADR